MRLGEEKVDVVVGREGLRESLVHQALAREQVGAWSAASSVEALLLKQHGVAEPSLIAHDRCIQTASRQDLLLIHTSIPESILIIHVFQLCIWYLAQFPILFDRLPQHVMSLGEPGIWVLEREARRSLSLRVQSLHDVSDINIVRLIQDGTWFFLLSMARSLRERILRLGHTQPFVVQLVDDLQVCFGSLLIVVSLVCLEAQARCRVATRRRSLRLLEDFAEVPIQICLQAVIQESEGHQGKRPRKR